MTPARRWGLAALAASLLLFLTALAAPFLVDLSSFRPQIQRVVRDVVGAELEFDSLRLTLLPRIGVRLLDARLLPANKHWEEPLLQLDRFDLGLAWLPLLGGAFELVGEIDDLRIFVARNGTDSNFDGLFPTPNTATVTAPQADAAATSAVPDLPPLRLRSLNISPISVIYHESTTAGVARYALTDARISAFNVAPGERSRLMGVLPIAIERPELDANGAIRVAAEASLPPLDALTAPISFDADVDASELGLSLPGILRRAAGQELRLIVSGRTDDQTPLGVWLRPLRMRIGDIEVAPEISGLDALHISRIDAALTFTEPERGAHAFALVDLEGRAGPAEFAVPLSIAVRGAADVTTASCIPCAFSVTSRDARVELQQPGEPARLGLDLGVAGQTIVRESTIHRASAGLSIATQFHNLIWRTPTTEVSGDGSLQITGSTELVDNAPTNLRATARGDLSHVHLWLDGLLNKPAGEPLRLEAVVAAPATTRVRGSYALEASGLSVRGNFGLRDVTRRLKAHMAARLEAHSPTSQWILARPDLVTRTTVAVDLDAVGQLSRPATLRVDADVRGQIASSDIDARIWLTDLDSPAVDINVRSTRLDLDELSGAPASGPTAAEAPATEPESEFCLTETDLTMLRPTRLTFRTKADRIILDGVGYDNAVLDLLLAHGKLNIRQLELGLFGGRASGTLNADLNRCPFSWGTGIDLRNIQTEPLIALYEPRHRKLLQAGADMTLEVTAAGTTSATIRRSLNGAGTFLLHDGTLNTISLANEIEQQVDAFVAGLSIVDAADDLFATAEKLMANPLVQKSAAARKADPATWRRKYDTFRSFSIAGLLSVDKGIRDTAGELTFHDGHLLISARNDSPSGRYDVDASIAPDDRLSGAAEYIASASVKQKMLARSPYAALLFDDKGDFRLRMKLRGTLTEPSVSIDLTPLREGFRARSRERVRQDILAPLQQAAKDAVRGNLPDAREAAAQPKETIRKAADRAKSAGNSVREQGRQAVDGIGKKLFGR